jgi:hypothetical protein
MADEVGASFGGLVGSMGKLFQMRGAKPAEREKKEVVATRTDKQKAKARERAAAGRTEPMNIRCKPSIKTALEQLGKKLGGTRTDVFEIAIRQLAKAHDIEIEGESTDE